MQATAIAHANIALVKYWGKRDVRLNLPAVGSISVTLKNLFTRTKIIFDPNFDKDELIIDSVKVEGKAGSRVAHFLSLFRQRAQVDFFAHVESENNFPTGAGLASSASGFAALTIAANAALKLNLSSKELSIFARQGSGSAARSVFGGFVEMKKGEKRDGSDSFAVKLADETHWDLHMLIAITSEKAKKMGSTDGMVLSEKTSPYYSEWVRTSEIDLTVCREAILNKDFSQLAEVAEYSCLKMHALAMSSQPGLIYWNGATVEVLHTIRELRRQGIPVFFTIDAGPQVKAICEPKYIETVKKNLEEIKGVKRVIHTPLGPDAKII
ncbi:diphosphomevalonate decarboxylase [candidate division KSB1 bacterium 4484_87]|nr:MAG: diphosphomevalonate decarboxylase [candidate division KSB1 bacterium 4484_87]